MEALRCLSESHLVEEFKDDGLQTVTSTEQVRDGTRCLANRELAVAISNVRQ